MKPFLIRWACTTFAVFIATGIVPGIGADSVEALMWAGLLLGVLNAVVRPVLLVLSLPLIVLSFGLVIPLINAMLLSWVGGGWIAGFHVAGFGSALFGAVVISFVSWAVNRAFKEDGWSGPGGGGMRARPFTAPPPPEPPPIKKVEGRVIE